MKTQPLSPGKNQKNNAEITRSLSLENGVRQASRSSRENRPAARHGEGPGRLYPTPSRPRIEGSLRGDLRRAIAEPRRAMRIQKSAWTVPQSAGATSGPDQAVMALLAAIALCTTVFGILTSAVGMTNWTAFEGFVKHLVG